MNIIQVRYRKSHSQSIQIEDNNLAKEIFDTIEEKVQSGESFSIDINGVLQSFGAGVLEAVALTPSYIIKKTQEAQKELYQQQYANQTTGALVAGGNVLGLNNSLLGY